MSLLTVGITINGVYIHPMGAYPNGGGQMEHMWEVALIDKIPEMGEKYMELFIECNFDPFSFIKQASKLEDKNRSMITELRKPENKLQLKDIGKEDPEVLLRVLYKKGGTSDDIQERTR